MFTSKKQGFKKIIFYTVMLLIAIYPIEFWGTDSYESTFVMFSMFGILGNVYLNKHEIIIDDFQKHLYYALAIIISLMFVIADYSHFVNGTLSAIVKAGLALVCGFFVFKSIIVAVYCVLMNRRQAKYEVYSKRNMLLGAFLLPVAIDNIYLRFCAFPGWIDSDALSQLGQMLSGNYSNHHPFWHTKFMEMIILPIYRLTNEGNMATYTFCVIQIIIMSLVFVYAVDTIYYFKISKLWMVVIIIVYSLSPYNVGMSAGVLKDSMFSIAISLMVVAFVRLLNKLGDHHIFDYIMLVMGLLGSCLFKTNGMYAMIFTACLAWLLLGKDNKKLLVVFTGIIVFSFILNKMYIGYKNIPQPDTVESLSIPLQQIARTACDHKEISENSRMYIDKLVGYEKMGEAYVPNISDSVKNIIRNEGNQSYLNDNKAGFIRVWLDIGIHHPFNYLKGWVDQTRGYWGPAYCFGGAQRGILKETNGLMNLHNVSLNNAFLKAWDVWEKILLTNFIPGFEMIFSQGIRLWILVFGFIWALFQNRKNSIICIIPISIVMTLVIATPVCAELRYSYPIYEVFSVIMIATFGQVTNNEIGDLKNREE